MSGNFLSPADALVRGLRRRLWLERVFWLALIGLLAAVHFGAIPGGRRALLIAVNGEPVAVVASRSDARRLLGEVKSSSGLAADKITFPEEITFHSVPAARNPVQSDTEAMKALAARVHPVVRASAIIANGEVVLALPDQREAVKALSAILRRFSPPGENTRVYFKEEVKIETRDVPPGQLCPSAQEALQTIEQASRPKGEYEVRPGDSGWRIAGQHHVPLSRLAAANPDVDLNRVRAGQRLKIPGELPPLTVVARKEIQQPLGDGPEAPTLRVRIVYENGAVISREVVGRPPRHGARTPPPATRPHRPRGDIIR